MKRRFPFETAVGFQIHAEKRVRQAGEVIVVYARIHKRGGESDLTDVILHREFGAPERQSRPAVTVYAVVRHATVDIVLDASLLGGVGERTTDGDLVAPEGGVDEGQLGAGEEVRYEGFVLQRADDEANVLERFQLLCHEAIFRSELGADVVADGGGDARERGGLSTGGVDDGDRLRGHPGFSSTSQT